MRKVVLGLLICCLVAGCGKKGDNTCTYTYDPCSNKASASEIAAVQSYLATNSITATQHCSGVFYIITAPGAGATPTVCNNIDVTYTGKLTSGTTFDSGRITYPLGNLITGWQATLPLIKEGGNIRLFIPPSLGYGSQPYGSIPANSILIFDITLNAVK